MVMIKDLKEGDRVVVEVEGKITTPYPYRKELGIEMGWINLDALEELNVKILRKLPKTIKLSNGKEYDEDEITSKCKAL